MAKPQRDTLVVVPPADNRQKHIEMLEVGETVSIARRIDLAMGVPEGMIADHMHNLRSLLDVQARRARRKFTGRTYIVEGGDFVTRSSAIMLTAVLTRLA